MARATSTDPPPSETDNMSEIKEAMEPKLSGLRDLLVEAEKLRLQTLQELFAVLSPTQAAQYMVAAIEMTYAVRKLGEQVREAQGDQCLWSPGHTGGLNIKEMLRVAKWRSFRRPWIVVQIPPTLTMMGELPWYVLILVKIA